MPGFFVSNRNVDVLLVNEYQNRCLYEEIESDFLTIKRNTLDKFQNDKTMMETESIIIVSEGYLLNKQELFQKYCVNSVADLLIEMYQQIGERFFSELRGSFSGAIYEKAVNKWVIYTNHTGDSPIFYTVEGEVFYVGSQVNYVIDACRKQNIELTFDEQAAYQMLTYAFMVDDSTYAREIKRLRGGTYICVEKGAIQVKEYHRFYKNTKRFEGKCEDEIIDALDAEFRHAIELEYAKDEEYHCEHLVDMSGGLDSRMNAWIAHTIKQKSLQLLTYCKADYLDEKIAKEIAIYWKDELFVKILDDATFLYDIDEIVRLSGGLSLYSGITGGKRMLERLSMERYGLEHTGMLGDVVIGSYCKFASDNDQRIPSGKYSEKMNARLGPQIEKVHNQFADHELFLLYARGFQGVSNTFSIRKNYTEVVSPFMYVDFLQLCLDIPLEYRIQHRIYKKWIISRYPEATKFKWESTGCKITDSDIAIFLHKLIKKGPQKLLRIIGYSNRINTGMNPLDYWISHDDNLRNYLDEYERDAYQYLPKDISKQIFEDMRGVYKRGTASEKAMVLTVLSSAKMYFGDSK